MFDPFNKVIEIFQEEHPGHDVKVVWCVDLVAKTAAGGMCKSPNDASEAGHMIFIDPSLPVTETLHVLIHELAHVAVPVDCGSVHGAEFQRVVDALTFEFAPTAEQLGLPVEAIAVPKLTDDREEREWVAAEDVLSRAMWACDHPVSVKGGTASRSGNSDEYRERAGGILAILANNGFFLFGADEDESEAA